MKEKKPRSLKQILMAGLGRSWMAWPPRNEVKRRCKVIGRAGWWTCEECKEAHEKIEIDHIHPVVPVVEGFTGWDAYIASKFVGADALRGLCRDCHGKKTKEENKKRREIKKEKNNG